MKGQGDSQKKKRCCCSFTLKRFYLHPTVVKISYTTFQHVNKLGLVVHGNVKSSYKSTFSAPVSKETRSFVLENLRLGLSIYQVMNKHKSQIKEIMENNGNLPRDFFLCEQDIRNMVGKLAKETYKKDENDVRMWVIENKEKVFFYQEFNVQVEGNLNGGNMPFTNWHIN
jgi:hypothetical protein